MAPRSFWKGHLKISLVNVPVKMISASQPVSKTTVSFHKYHAACMGRVSHKSFCAACNEEIPSGESLRGYEYSKGSKPIIVSDDELEACEEELANAHTIEITATTTERIDPVYIDSMAYLVCGDPVGAQAFETLRLSGKDRLLVGQVVLKQMNTLVALEAVDNAFIVYRLRAREEVRLLDELDPVAAVAPGKSDVQLATLLLDQLDGTLDYSLMKDVYTDRVRELLAAKAAGKAAPKAAPAAKPSATASSLADMLKASLSQLPKRAKPAKAEITPKKARKTA